MKIFATRVWGFGAEWPIITFTRDGDRDNLIRKSKPGDRIIFVATQGEQVPVEERGCILGMAEIGRTAIDTLEVLNPTVLKPHDYDEAGRFRWPKALPMLRAWRFTERPRLTDTLSKQLPYNATSQAVELSTEDAEAVLRLSVEEVLLPDNEVLTRLRGMSDALKGRSKGPVPANWVGESGQNPDQVGFTYVFRFGDTTGWKIGRAVNVVGRLAEVNKHIPQPITGAKWEPFLQHKWADLYGAHDMEQRVLSSLDAHSIGGEMVRCSESQLTSAWYKSIIG